MRLSGSPRSFGILSTYPPTACGLATFSAALAKGLRANGAAARVVRIADGERASSLDIVGELVNGSASSVAAAAALLSMGDIAVVQHEYGLYGGRDGDEVLDVVEATTVPTIVVAHTVLNRPTEHQHSVLAELADRADAVVVMSEAARRRLCDRFGIDPEKVITISHGAVVPPPRARPAAHQGATLLTWGLVGPGKGIERVIDAMAELQSLPQRPRYLVAGRTHPKVLAADGEAYRNARMQQARSRGVVGSVAFDPTYRNVDDLTRLIQSASVAVLPYDSTDQVTSGVLVDAVAAGRPVIATAFPHALELLASGAGIVVDHDDPHAMTLALSRVLTQPRLAEAMAAEAARLAPGLGWPVVARDYMDLASRIASMRPALV